LRYEELKEITVSLGKIDMSDALSQYDLLWLSGNVGWRHAD